MSSSPKIALREWYARQRFALSAANHSLYLAYANKIYKPRPTSAQEVFDRFSRKLGRPVIFVQVGANDGITHDPVHLFIKRDGWQGVMLEPQKLLCEQFLVPLYAKNSGVKVINAAIGEGAGEATLYTLGFSSKRWATGVATFEKNVLQAAIDNGHIARRAAKAGDTVPLNEQLIHEIQVPIISPDVLLAEAKISHIDVLQIDTEGFDFEVIKLFDIKQRLPTIINFESAHLSPLDMEACTSLLEQAGYVWRTTGGDTIALQPSAAQYLNPE